MKRLGSNPLVAAAMVAISVVLPLNAGALELSSTTEVRRSTSSTCHPPGSSHYDRVKTYTTVSLQTCLDNGGRLPRYLESLYAAEKQVEQAEAFCKDNADDAKCPRIQISAVANAAKQEANAEAENDAIKQFAGFNFGIGIASLSYSDDQIDEVKIIDGIVRITEERQNKASVMFESHIFLYDSVRGRQRFGIGPFLAASLADSDGADPLSSYGAGVMLGFKRREGSSSWNIGLGYFVDTESTELIEGVMDGDATDVTNLTRTTDASGWMLMFSSSC